MNSDNISKYMDCMEEVKRRIDFIQGEDQKKVLNVPEFESICLQFRQVLELVAFSSLSANQEEYAKAYANFSSHWNAKRILEYLEKVNPRFYPAPTEQKVLSQGHFELAEIKDGYLTKEDFVEAYDACSSVVHVTNPYGVRQYDPNELRKRFSEWADKIVRLLNHHNVQLVDDSQMFVVGMNNGNGQAFYGVFEKMS